MIFYNWNKIVRETNKSSVQILKIIRYLTFKPKVLVKKDRYYKISKVNWHGDSFLINPEPIFYERRKYDDLDLVHYIGAASLRNLVDYRINHKITLDLFACDSFSHVIRANPLLEIEGTNVLFKFEEEFKEKEKNGISIW